MEVRERLIFHAEKEYQKLDFFLKSHGISRRIITKLKYAGCLLINGDPATVIQPVCQGDTVTIRFPREETLSCLPQKGDLRILYEDRDILVLDKPYGIATHPALGTKDGTLGNFVSCYFLEEGCPMPFRPIHRLDKTTSGVIVVAKHALAHYHLAEQMKNRTFQKKYLALVWSVPKTKKGKITFPIARESETSLRRICHPNGKEAETCYRLLHHTETASLLELKIRTGRTHQIRVHLQAIGHPVIGDTVYGGIKGDRLYLHSYQAKLIHPITGNAMTFCAPCDFASVLQTFGKEDPTL